MRHPIVIAATAALAWAAVGGFAAAQTTGLVAAYAMDEGTGTTLTDHSGNNNTGTLTNGPTWTTGKTQLPAQRHAAGLPGKERIRAGLDHKPVRALRTDLAPKALSLLEHRDLGVRRALQQAKRRGEPGNPAPDNRDLDHVASTDRRR